MAKGRHRFYDGRKPVRQPLAAFLAPNEVVLKQYTDPNQSRNDLTTPTQEADRVALQDVARTLVQQVIVKTLEKVDAPEKAVVKKPLTKQQETAARVNRYNSIWQKYSNEDRTKADTRPSISVSNK